MPNRYIKKDFIYIVSPLIFGRLWYFNLVARYNLNVIKMARYNSNVWIRAPDSPRGRIPLDCHESILRLLAARSRAAGMLFLSPASRFYIRGSILPPWFHSPTAVPLSRRGSPVAGGRRCVCAWRRRLGAGYTARWLTCRCCRLPFRMGTVCPVTIYYSSI